MEIMTRDFGKVNVDESKIFNFPSGLFAFEECRQFALLSPLGDGVYPMWLQSTENVTPCFIVFDPAIIDGAYKITLNSSEKKLLKIDDSSNVRCLSIAVVPEDYKKTTVNMKCPIVITRISPHRSYSPKSMRYVCRYMWIRGQSNACSNTKNRRKSYNIRQH